MRQGRLMRIAAYASILVLCALWLNHAGCACVEDGGDSMTFISGTVTDSLTGSLLDSAVILLNDTLDPGRTIHTDTLGQYKLVEMGLGEFRIYCTKTGYTTKLTAVRSNGARFMFEDINFELVPK